MVVDVISCKPVSHNQIPVIREFYKDLCDFAPAIQSQTAYIH